MPCQDGRQRRSLVGSGSHDEATDKPLAHADKSVSSGATALGADRSKAGTHAHARPRGPRSFRSTTLNPRAAALPEPLELANPARSQCGPSAQPGRIA